MPKKSQFTSEEIDRMAELRDNGLTLREVGEKFRGVSASDVYSAMSSNENKRRGGRPVGGKTLYKATRNLNTFLHPKPIENVYWDISTVQQQNGPHKEIYNHFR